VPRRHTKQRQQSPWASQAQSKLFAGDRWTEGIAEGETEQRFGMFSLFFLFLLFFSFSFFFLLFFFFSLV